MKTAFVLLLVAGVAFALALILFGSQEFDMPEHFPTLDPAEIGPDPAAGDVGSPGTELEFAL